MKLEEAIGRAIRHVVDNLRREFREYVAAEIEASEQRILLETENRYLTERVRALTPKAAKPEE